MSPRPSQGSSGARQPVEGVYKSTPMEEQVAADKHQIAMILCLRTRGSRHLAPPPVAHMRRDGRAAPASRSPSCTQKVQIQCSCRLTRGRAVN